MIFPIRDSKPNPDITPPSIILVSPQDNIIHKSGFPIEFNITDYHINTVWYNWDSTINQTLIPPYIVYLPSGEGTHMLYIFANDTRGNTQSKVFQFITDDISPTIKLIDPPNETVHKSGYLINLSISDSHLHTVIYHWDSDDNSILNYPYNVYLPVGDSSHWLFITCNDSAGNMALQQFLFITDDTPPIIILNSPSNNSIKQSNTVIDLSVFDDFLSTVYYHWDNQSNISLLEPYDVFLPNGDGPHELWIYANDTLGSLS